MTCKIHNNCGADFGDLENHIQDMYSFFAKKYSFDKHPAIHLDSDEQNKAEILGKTAYYDPQSFEVHIYTDGRHPKDMLRSVAHELIHHKQNLEDRLQVGGYNGPGYYLENDELKEVEHEAMLEGNACMREWEDTKKYKNPKENGNMSLKEWKNNELNQLLLKKWGIISEGKKKPDADGDGVPDWADKKDGDDNADKKSDKKSSKPKKGKVPPQLQKHVKGKKEDLDEEKDCMNEECGDYKEMEEGRMNPRTTNSDKFTGHEDRYQPDRIHEADDEEGEMKNKDSKNKKYNFDKKDGDSKEKENTLQEDDGEELDEGFDIPKGTVFDDIEKQAKIDRKKYKNVKQPPLKTDPKTGEKYRSYLDEDKNNTLQEAIKRISKAKKVFLRGRRIK